MGKELFHEIALKSNGKTVLDTCLGEIKKLRAELAACQTERNAFQDQCIRRKRELSACQADNLRLRDTVEFLRKTYVIDEGYESPVADEALATPTGDLSALREVCAKVLEEVQEGICTITLARHIREGTWNPEVLK